MHMVTMVTCHNYGAVDKMLTKILLHAHNPVWSPHPGVGPTGAAAQAVTRCYGDFIKVKRGGVLLTVIVILRACSREVRGRGGVKVQGLLEDDVLGIFQQVVNKSFFGGRM